MEAAILVPAKPTSSPESGDTQYVAVKKLRFDAETDDDRALAVSLKGGAVRSVGGFRYVGL